MPSRHTRAQHHDASELLWVADRPAGGCHRVIVDVVGEVDHYTAPLLGDCLQRHCDRRGLRELVVDLDGVTFLGGAGLTVLARTRRRCSARGIRLVVWSSGHRAVLRSLQWGGLSDLLPIDHAARPSPGAGIRPATVVHLRPGRRIGGTGKPQRRMGGKRPFRNLEQPWRAQ
jgi:anti-sigma B factor antagonist